MGLRRMAGTLRAAQRRFFGRADQREFAGFVLAERISSWLCPRLRFSEFGRTWLEDEAFFDYYERLVAVGIDAGNYHSADRKYFLSSLMGLVKDLPGDTAECGAYRGASSFLICKALEGKGKAHHVFDSFEGLSEPGELDGTYWKAGDLRSNEDQLKSALASFPGVVVHEGWIATRLADVADGRFCFVHVDVDLHEPTLQSVEFFYPRMVSGGVMLFDDYGFSSCAGARKAIDDFMADKPEHVVHVPTGQAFLIKK